MTSERLQESIRAAGFEPLRHVGSGAFADVWQVRCTASGEVCAWKQPRPEWEADRNVMRLLENELAVGRRVQSPRVIRVHHGELHRGPRHLLMEWFPGVTLEERLSAPRGIPLGEALWIVRQMAEGLRDLHAAGYQHGDAKPANVLVSPSGLVKLVDLGFAKPLDARLGAAGVPLMTGTPEYLAPELLSRAAGAGSPGPDLYGLGVTLYRALTGRLPFTGVTIADILRQHRQMRPHPIRRTAPHVPRDLADFAESLLAKQPLRRPWEWQVVIDALVQFELAELPELRAG